MPQRSARGRIPAKLGSSTCPARGTSAPTELVITEARTDKDALLSEAATRIDRYSQGLTKKNGLAGRYLDLNITVRATRN